jgi:hypothetical protein
VFGRLGQLGWATDVWCWWTPRRQPTGARGVAKESVERLVGADASKGEPVNATAVSGHDLSADQGGISN